MSDYDDGEEFIEGEPSSMCTFDHGPDEVCPECCDFGGDYSPGTKDCELCPWGNICAEEMERGD